jgi:hypothetical protein
VHRSLPLPQDALRMRLFCACESCADQRADEVIDSFVCMCRRVVAEIQFRPQSGIRPSKNFRRTRIEVVMTKLDIR